MTLNEFQDKALSFAIFPEDCKVIYPTLGLCGESGEVAEKVKKIIRDNNGAFTEQKKNEIALEVGDCLWYISVLANNLGYALEDIARMNYDKLESRRQRNKLHGNGDNR